MTIPKKLKVSGVTYTVSIVTEKELKDCTGQMDNEELTIKLRQAKPQAMELTFMHEIFHAINNEMKETDIEYLSQMFYGVLQDNPAVFTGGVTK